MDDNATKIPVADQTQPPELDQKLLCELYGLTVEEAYKLALLFYREQERDRAIAVDYSHRLKFIALSKQIKFGAYKEDGIECGWFDLVGNDARKVWKTIGSLTIQEAMLEFVRLLDAVCPTFRTQFGGGQQRKVEFVVASKLDGVEGGTAVDSSSDRNDNICLNSKGLLPDPLESKEILAQFEQQRRQIQEALNKQTYHQFLAYAQQTHPGETEKQEQLIQQLQEQHYQQYMSQVYAQAQAASQAATASAHFPTTTTIKNNNNNNNNKNGVGLDNVSDLEAALGATKNSSVASAARHLPKLKVRSVNEIGDGGGRGEGGEEGGDEEEEEGESNDSDVSDEEDSETPANPKVAPANVWTAKNLAEFKEAIKKEGPEGILKIGHGETVTVRVPTHPEGNSLFWEFCTDYYDIGFGVYFEWTVAESNQVTVHVDESGDEYEDEEGGGEGEGGENGGGGGNGSSSKKPGSGEDVEADAVRKQPDPSKPRVDEIIPTFRKDSHEEVFFGSHMYPGRGIYLLKFDNSYSLWRSKTLYYRVFYSK